MIQKIEIREFKNDRAYYCKVELIVELSNNRNIPRGISINFSNISNEWNYAIETGCKLFYEFYRHKSNESLNVEIKSVVWRPMETNTSIVIGATILCLQEALGYKLNGFEFDTNDSVIKLPI